MICKHIPQNQQKTSLWSGGKTTELYIYPQNAEYVDRNFLFRISSATVDTPTSRFTKLPGVSRTLVLLNGEMTLQFQGKEDVLLTPLGKAVFSGDWETTSVGQGVTDFNLMTQNGCVGAVEVHNVQAEQTCARMLRLDATCKCTMYGFFVPAGSFLLKLGSRQFTIKQGDFVMLAFEDGDLEQQTVHLIAQTEPKNYLVETRLDIC